MGASDGSPPDDSSLSLLDSVKGNDGAGNIALQKTKYGTNTGKSPPTARHSMNAEEARAPVTSGGTSGEGSASEAVFQYGKMGIGLSRPVDDDAASDASSTTVVTMSPVGGYTFSSARLSKKTDQLLGTAGEADIPTTVPNYMLSYQDSPHPIAEFWARLLLNHKRKIAAVWVVLALVGIFGAVRLVDETTVDIESPSGTLSYHARQILAENFPHYDSSSTFVLLFSSAGKYKQKIIPNDELKIVLDNLRTQVQLWSHVGFLQSVTDYYYFQTRDMPKLAETRVSEDHKYTMVTIDVRAKVRDKSTKDFTNFLSALRYPAYELTLIGAPVFEREAENAAKDDIINLLAGVTPITLAVMCFLVRSLRFIIIGSVCLFVCTSVSLAVAYIVSLTSSVSTTTPPLLLAFVIGCSVCYTLLLLHRFRGALLERRRNGLSLDRAYATKQALVHAGEAILVSGVTLAVCFLGLTIYPATSMRSFGVVCGLGVLTVVACSLTLSPLMLLVFRVWDGAIADSRWWDMWDDFWHLQCVKKIYESKVLATKGSTSDAIVGDEKSADAAAAAAAAAGGEKRGPSAARGAGGGDEGDYDSDWNDSFREVVPHDKRAMLLAANNSLVLKSDGVDEMSMWFLLGMVTTKFPISLIIILVVLAASLPLDLSSTTFDVTADSLSFVPQNSKVQRGYKEMGEKFSYGVVYPYTLCITATDHSNITDPANWEATYAYFYEFAQAHNHTANLGDINRIDSASMSAGHNGEENSVTLVPQMKYCAGLQAHVNATNPLPQYCWFLLHAWGYVSSDEKAMRAHFTSRHLPMSREGKNWLEAVRDLTYPGLSVVIAGEPADVIDSMDGVYANFPVMIAVTIITVVLVSLVSFKSIAIPIRALCTRAVTVAIVYGAANLIYCKDAFPWSTALSSPSSEITYTVVLQAVPLLVGLGLGLDFFVMTRIIEVRKQTSQLVGVTIADPTRRAVVLGMTWAGDIATAAGVVTIVCFAMLLVFSQVAVQNQVCDDMFSSYLNNTTLRQHADGLLPDSRVLG